MPVAMATSEFSLRMPRRTDIVRVDEVGLGFRVWGFRVSGFRV